MLRPQIRKLEKMAKDIAKERDGYRCFICGITKEQGALIDGHHIVGSNNYATKWCPDNIVTVCRSHHSMNKYSFHKDPECFEKWKQKYPQRWERVKELKQHEGVKHIYEDELEKLQNWL